MISSNRRLVLKLLSLLICLLISACTEGASDLAPGRPIKNFQLKQLDGDQVDLYDLLKTSSVPEGKTLVAFMASWCQSCKSEIPYLNQLNQKLKDQKKGHVVAIALDDTLDDLKKLKLEKSIEFPVFYDSQSKSRKYFRLTGFPEYILLDSNFAPRLVDLGAGNLNVKLIGPQDWAGLLSQFLS